MTKLHNTQGKAHFKQFDFSQWTLEQRLYFLEMAIEKRVKCLRDKINPEVPASAGIIYNRLRLPYQCQKYIDVLKANQQLTDQEREAEIRHIEIQFFGALETK